MIELTWWEAALAVAVLGAATWLAAAWYFGVMWEQRINAYRELHKQWGEAWLEHEQNVRLRQDPNDYDVA